MVSQSLAKIRGFSSSLQVFKHNHKLSCLTPLHLATDLNMHTTRYCYGQMMQMCHATIHCSWTWLMSRIARPRKKHPPQRQSKTCLKYKNAKIYGCQLFCDRTYRHFLLIIQSLRFASQDVPMMFRAPPTLKCWILNCSLIYY